MRYPPVLVPPRDDVTHEEALAVLQASSLYVLQIRHVDYGWQNIIENIRGISDARLILNGTKRKATDDPSNYRILLKSEDDRLREGIRIGRELGPPPEDRRLPSLYLPDRL